MKTLIKITQQGLFMLQVAFGQSKYYSDNLSENVKRGIRQKIRRGEYPTHAPVGYVNNPKTRNIEVEPIKARVIKQAFEEFAEGKHSLATMSQRLTFLGLVSRQGKGLSKSAVQRILTNPTYIGLLEFKGEMYEGKFEPILDKATFEAVQKELKRKSKARKQKHIHDFPFTGIIKCGECGGMITAQYAKKGKYIYYRCSKRMGVKCSQPYLQDVLLLGQIQAELAKVALPKDWAEVMLADLEQREKTAQGEQRSFSQNLAGQVKDIDGKLAKLVNAFLDGMVEQDAYLKKKEELLKAKVELQERLADFGKKGVAWFELTREWIKSAHQAEKLALSNDFYEIKSFLKKKWFEPPFNQQKSCFGFCPAF